VARIISITGDVGSGKSTVARIVAETLQCELVSTGAIQRQIAAEAGVSTLRLNEISMADRSIDDRIDDHLRALGRSSRSIVIDSRLAWFFVPDSYKVYITVDPVIAAQRLMSAHRAEEPYASVSEALKASLRRKTLENSRFTALYDVHCEDMRNYDLVVDSTMADALQVSQLVFSEAKSGIKQQSLPRGLLCPRRLLPTKSAGILARTTLARLRNAIRRNNVPEELPVDVVNIGSYFLIIDGHSRIARAIKAGLVHVPAVIHSEREETSTGGHRLGEIVRASFSMSTVREWEKAHDFKLASYPDAQFLPLDPV